LLKSLFASAQSIEQLLARKGGKIVMVHTVTGDLVPRLMNTPNLLWIMIGTLARQSGCPDNSKTGFDVVLSVELQQTLSVFKLRLPPSLRPARST
jgi:hypothetical protein